MVWDLCRQNPDKIVVALDVRTDEEIATRGWTQNSGRYMEEVMIEMSSAGVVAFLVSEAGRDALSDPPNLQILAEALAIVEEPVIASGGVRDLEDLRRLVALESAGRRLSGVVVGREVTAGRFTIEEAHEVLAGKGPSQVPGGIVATRQTIRVAALEPALEFLEKIVGLSRVRSSSGGVSGTILEAVEGHQLQLVEAPVVAADPFVFVVENTARWREHFKAMGVETVETSAGLQLSGPDGLIIRFE
jgi:tRNA-dihydrouridine synthase